jgi:hypothetical protein
MDNKPEQRPARQAKKDAIKALNTSSTVNPGTKKRSAATHESSGRAKARKTKARKTKPLVPSASSASSAFSPHVEEGVENVDPSLKRTPTTKRIVSHAGLTKTETGPTIYAPDMEAQIAAEARGVTRKNIPWDTFRSTYLCGFSIKDKDQPTPTAESMKKIGEGNWEEKQFWGRLHKTLSDEVRYSGCAFIYLSVLY